MGNESGCVMGMAPRESHASHLVLIDPFVVRCTFHTLAMRRQYRTGSCHGVSLSLMALRVCGFIFILEGEAYLGLAAAARARSRA